MTCWLSEPVESLLAAGAESATPLETDVVIAGSGYGAAMAALAILERYSSPGSSAAGNAPTVWVFEAGREYLPDDFPKTVAQIPGFAGTDNLNAGALWDIRPGDGVISISGRGLGGTSLINANVAARAPAAVFEHWPDNQRIRWHQRFVEVYDKIERLLGVSAWPEVEQSGRVRALTASAQALGGSTDTAPLTINFAEPTEHSTDHEPCNRCGNCVTGCHSGAKGSLNMNAWPLAKQMGASLYTGVQVRSLRRNADQSWQLTCVPTGKTAPVFEVRAATVILAAGTLGSTEILKRSAHDHGLGVSNRLGQRFSLNGDALVAAIGQHKRVGELAGGPGPTIGGVSRVPLQVAGDNPAESTRDWITVEDAQIPHALQQIWQEMIVSQALLRRFGDGSESAWHRFNVAHDPLAISDDLAAHTQTLLIMGHDDARGELQWKNDRLTPSWKRTNDDYYDALNQRLQAGESAVFDGGLYSPNLISQPLPSGFEDVLEGASQMQGPLLTVHPLGGCCMGESAQEGVVNTAGQVFTGAGPDGDQQAVYANLYVMDGAIIPGAVGINPFLTIASLSYVLASNIPVLQQKSVDAAPVGQMIPLVNLQAFPRLERYRRFPAGTRWPLPPATKEPVEAVFSERLVCHLPHSHRSSMPWSTESSISVNKLKKALPALPWPETFNALVLDVRFEFAGAQSLDQWIRQPGAVLQASAVLSVDRSGQVFTVNDSKLSALTTLHGVVRLGVSDKAGTGSFRRWCRTVGAVIRFVRFRPMDVLLKCPPWLIRLCLSKQALAIRDSELRKKKTRSTLSELKEFWRIARLQSEPRYLHYQFSNSQGLGFSGRKTLAYGITRRDLLAALMVLPMDVQVAGSSKMKLQFELDAVKVTDGPSPLQITASPDLPSSLMAAGGFAMYFLRMIMNTHFWSFAAPAYKQFAAREQMESGSRQGRFAEPPDVIFYGAGGKKQSTRREKFEQGAMQSGKLRPIARLVRYQPSEGNQHGRRSLLLVHGLAHSSRVFWTDTIDCNFVQYFLAQNYDVWILDHRASANYIRDINPEDRWDDIALIDIPWAVKTIFNQINQLAIPGEEKHIHVFSHCIGAGAVAMAVLAGKLNYEQRLPDGEFVQRSMLASLVPHAVTPWLHASAENRARANVWAWVKEFEPIRVIEPLPYRDPELLEMVYDRLASLAMTEDERKQWCASRSFTDWRGPGFAQSIYTRYTIFWGRQWHNRNISKSTRYEFAGMIGPVPIGVMQQVYFSLTRGLLSDHEGSNAYVREENFENFWQFPTLFLHGNRNTVFDQESSRHSADQLTRLRIRQVTGTRHDGELQAEDYARHQVWIEILNDYGHMDMIFSKCASHDVYPRLHEFMSAAENNEMERLCQRRMSLPGARDRFALQCMARSEVVPSRRPRTGPIISSPRLNNDGSLRIRVWAEAEDFSVYSAQGLLIRHTGDEAGNAQSANLRQLRYAGLDGITTGAESRIWAEEFWLHDLTLALPLTNTLRLSLRMPGDDATDFGADDGIVLDWRQLPWLRRVSGEPISSAPSLTLLLGSCLYPGLPFDRAHSYRVFRAIREQIMDDTRFGRGADGLMLLGDQIYADATAELFDPRAHYERYRNPYRLAFNQPELAYVLSHLPSWFVVDDHEYRDNWRGLSDENLKQEYGYARRMAGLYQMHQHEHWHPGSAPLWYHFQCADYPVFVFDTRTERHFDASAPSRLLDVSQLQGFKSWLASHKHEIVIIATGSPLGPISRAMIESPALAQTDDSLLAYPRFLAFVVEVLAQQAPGKKIVWLTGDPHLSCVVSLMLESGASRVSVLQICSSGLNSPLPFVNAQKGDYDWDAEFEISLREAATEVRIRGMQHLITDHSQHFVRLDIDAESGYRLTAQAYDAASTQVGQPFSTDWHPVSSLIVNRSEHE